MSTFCLVVDASVACAASSAVGASANASLCFRALEAVLRICHRIAMTAKSVKEWDEHKSRFATEWLTLMFAKGKVQSFRLRDLARQERRWTGAAQSKRQAQCMRKDAHLVATAIAIDERIVSADEQARGLYARAATRFAELRGGLWVNPCLETDCAVAWLEAGAPAEKRRLLWTLGRASP